MMGFVVGIRRSLLLSLLLAFNVEEGYGFTQLGPLKRWGGIPREKEFTLEYSAPIKTQRSGPLQDSKDSSSFSLANLFGSGQQEKKSDGGSVRGAAVKTHPSVRNHISPLNRLDMEKLKAPASPDSLPVHPQVKSGVLDNGLHYVILPNKVPPGRFEAHLEVFSGSADELESQQGIAHLTEHVAYMGSRKRERLFGTGSQTNAYTDFHHTVFYAACPNVNPRGGGPMLPMALDALVDVMEARVESSRLEKERAAVLSEMTMVNTIEYRVECQILTTLHRENRLAKRLPIGKESLIRSWTTDDVKTWHRTHYRPDNVLLYLVGDVDPEEAEKVIQEKFGPVTAEKQANDLKNAEMRKQSSDLADAVIHDTVKAAQSWHYPPVRHDWCVPKDATIHQDLIKPEKGQEEYDVHLQQPYPLDDTVDKIQIQEVAPGKKIRPHIYRHELLQAFSLHLFAKRPVDPIVDIDSLKRNLARRIALAALQIRLNVGGRDENPAFTFVEFNQLDSAREGCAVCSLDMTADPPKWRDAVCKSLSEIRKLGLYGVTPGEMERYTSSLLTDAEQLASLGDKIRHGDLLSSVMERVSNGHTVMSADQSFNATIAALQSLTIDDVNQAAAELCSHITSFNKEADPSQGTAVVIACTPKNIDEDSPAFCDGEGLVKAIEEACQQKVEPEKDLEIPQTLIPVQEIQEAMKTNPPEWKNGTFTDGTPDTDKNTITRPFTLRRLGNGIRVGIANNAAESQRGHLRLVAPGGRDAEKRLGFKNGAMAIGARTMQEGGAFGPWTREQVEIFCVDHLLMVEISCNDDSLTIDFVFPTTNVANVGFGDDLQLGITGTESVLQVIREIIMGFKWEDDAHRRSKQFFRTSHLNLLKNLEGLSTERIIEAMTEGDKRFLSVDLDSIEQITLDDAKRAVMSQLQPSDLEISVAGDLDVADVLEMIYKYVGTIPANTNEEYKQTPTKELGSLPPVPSPGKFINIELEDPDPRAVAYVAGSAPNGWGRMIDGSTVAEKVLEADKKASDYDKKRRAHPLFAHVSLSLISEIINRRLFANVRERKQLTYDANFCFAGFDRLDGGWYLVTVTTNKDKAQKALEACKETILSLKKASPITQESVESAKRVLLNRFEGELQASSYWTQLMSGMQDETIPNKGPLSGTDYMAVVRSITARDLQLALECLGLDEKELYTCIGQTIKPEGTEENDTDETVRSPIMGMRRGMALKN